MGEGNVTTSIEPKNILELISEDVIKYTLAGFSYWLQASVAILYPLKQPPAQDELKLILPTENHLHNEICRVYRSISACDDKCAKVDCQAAWGYINNPDHQAGPHIYQCHLKLRDMAYPLRAGGRVWGVLFAGQIMLDDPDHEKDIRAAILAHTPKDKSHKVLQSLATCKKLTLDELNKRFEEFYKVGKMMQLLVDEAYKKFFDAKFHSFCVNTGLKLTFSPPRESDWWDIAAKSSRRFCDYIEVESVRFFSRNGGRYELKATEKGAWPYPDEQAFAHIRIPTRLLAVLPENELCPLPKGIANRLGLPTNKPGYIFKKDMVEKPQLRISTAIVLIGTIPSDKLDSVIEYCRLVCLQAGVTSLVFRVEKDVENTEGRIQNVFHHVKTPLQWIVNLQNDNNAFTHDKITDTRDKVTSYALQVNTYLRYLREASDSTPEPVDLIKLTAQVVENYKPAAQEKIISIIWVSPPLPTIVHADPVDLRVVLDNLLGNAIKYSWSGGPVVRLIHLEMVHQGRYALLRIENYGIGIDSITLNVLNDGDEHYGVRAGIEDKWSEKRLGEGRGIAICKEILESYDGWLVFDSKPVDIGLRSEAEMYHRYLTAVTVCLPLSER